MFKISRYYTIYSLILVTLTACAGLPFQALAPQVSIADFRIANIGILEQNYILKLRLRNPNPFPLPINRLDYTLFLNDKEFTKGNSLQPLTLAAAGENTLELNITSNLWKIVEQWQNWTSSFSRQFNYRLSGGVNVLNSTVQIPFEYKGDVTLNWRNN